MTITDINRSKSGSPETADSRLDVRGIPPTERQDEVLELLRAAMPGDAERWVNQSLWDWKHVTNPFGASLVLIAESGGGQIAGLRAFMRWRLRVASRTLEAYRPVDTATHPDFRRLGIFTRLTLAAVEHARGAGGDIIFNTPQQHERFRLPQDGVDKRWSGCAVAAGQELSENSCEAGESRGDAPNRVEATCRCLRASRTGRATAWTRHHTQLRTAY